VVMAEDGYGGGQNFKTITLEIRVHAPTLRAGAAQIRCAMADYSPTTPASFTF